MKVKSQLKDKINSQLSLLKIIKPWIWMDPTICIDQK